MSADVHPRNVPSPASRRILPSTAGRRRRLAAALALVALIGALAIWFLKGARDEHAGATRAPATQVSPAQLSAIASRIPHPVYWAGTRPGSTYELTRTGDGRIYVRYLRPGTAVGSGRADALTIGTYPLDDAFSTLKATARKQGAATIALAGGGLAFQDAHRPASVYLAYPTSDYQVEVFDPSPGRALALVRSGGVSPIARPASRPVSVSQLQALAAGLGHPLYWAGRQSGHAYELTRTSDGSVYVRYLSPGAEAGDSSARYLTVGTYPQKDALAALQAAAAKAKVRTLALPGGGLAYVDARHPTSAYLAYPGADLLVEVYTPEAANTLKLVTSGQITALR